MSMMRQLGCPTFFLTLSAAETKWLELLKILKEILDGVKFSDDDIIDLQWSERADLIRRDPVTCARYFDHRSREFFKVLKTKVSPLGVLTDYYLRIEFQHRGSPHVHSLLWIQNAPKYGRASNSEIINFINAAITCNSPSDDSVLSHNDIQLQLHKHTHTCYKKKGIRRCRFDIPYPPMASTQILEPFELSEQPSSKEDKLLIDSHKQASKKIYKLIDEVDKIDNDLNIKSFTDFLSTLQLTEEQYLLALRSSFIRPTVFLKRNVNELRINAYNETVLHLWKANMDLQYILDPYACVVYIISYIGKSQRGMSKLLKDALLQLKAGNATVKERLRSIAHKFQNCSEVSAQEVSYHLLSLPLSQCSRANVYINTNPPEQRTRMLKPKRILKDMEVDSEDILQEGLIEQYTNRPNALNDTCLASFAAWYEYQSAMKKRDTLNDFEDYENIDNFDESNIRILPILPLKCKEYIRMRRKAKVIRFRRFNIVQDEDNFYREQIMLYLPWTNECRDLLNINLQMCYNKNYLRIMKNRLEFESNDQERIDEALQVLADIDPDDINFDNVAIEEILDNEGINVIEDSDYQIDYPGDIVSTDPNTAPKEDPAKYYNIPNLRTEEEYLSMCRCLNNKQQSIFLHTLHCFKTNKQLPMYLYIAGGAGVGKIYLFEFYTKG